MTNPVFLLPGAHTAMRDLYKVIQSTDVPASTLELVHLRISQINGCAACAFAGVDTARKRGETEDRLHSVAVWRESPLFTEPERAALELAEAATRITDRHDAVTDEIWRAAAEHYDEKQLAGLVLMVGITNCFNRVNNSTRQPAGQTA